MNQIRLADSQQFVAVYDIVSRGGSGGPVKEDERWGQAFDLRLMVVILTNRAGGDPLKLARQIADLELTSR